MSRSTKSFMKRFLLLIPEKAGIARLLNNDIEHMNNSVR